MYTFPVRAGQTVYAQSWDPSGKLGWRLYDPDGQLLLYGYLTVDIGRLPSPPSDGSYRLVVEGERDATGAYGLKLCEVSDRRFTLDLSQAPVTASGTVATPGEQHIYSFAAQPGQAVYLQREEGTEALSWVLTDPKGFPLGGGRFDSDVGRVFLSDSGTHRIVVTGYGSEPAAYRFKLWDATRQSFALTLGDRVANGSPAAGAGNLETPGAEDFYTFDTLAGQTVYLRATGAVSDLRWTLQMPFDLLIPLSEQSISRSLDTNIVRMTCGLGGTWNLLTQGTGAAHGEYGFWLSDGLPRIVSQPASQAVSEGASTSFSVEAESAPPVSYQWRKDGQELDGATNRTFNLLRASAADAGAYSVLARTEAGSVASAAATLTVFLRLRRAHAARRHVEV